MLYIHMILETILKTGILVFSFEIFIKVYKDSIYIISFTDENYFILIVMILITAFGQALLNKISLKNNLRV